MYPLITAEWGAVRMWEVEIWPNWDPNQIAGRRYSCTMWYGSGSVNLCNPMAFLFG